ncbi:MAG: sigma-70 family RNA polymerase sigma factor [Victivallales bacterium]
MEFYQTYLPLIRMRGRDHGLSLSETDELVQNTVLSVFEGSCKFYYDPAKGRFRDFLRKIIDCRAVDIMRQRHYERKTRHPEEEVIPDDRLSELERRWDDEWKDHVLKESLKELKSKIEPETYQAFEFYALKGMTAKQVAEFLGINEDIVYVSRYRAVSKLREIIKTIVE